jgi:hypothetical protein
MSFAAFNQGEWSMVDSGRLGATASTCFLTETWLKTFELLLKNQLGRYLMRRLKKQVITAPSEVGVDVLVWFQNEAANDLSSKFADADSSSSFLSRLLRPLTQVDWMTKCGDGWTPSKSKDADVIKAEVLAHVGSVVWKETKELLVQLLSIFYDVKATTADTSELVTASRSKIYASLATAMWKAGAIKKLQNSAKISASDFLLAWVRSVLFAHKQASMSVLIALFNVVRLKPTKMHRAFDAEPFERVAMKACVTVNDKSTYAYKVADVKTYVASTIRDELQAYIDEMSAPSVNEIHTARYKALEDEIAVLKQDLKATVAAVQSNNHNNNNNNNNNDHSSSAAQPRSARPRRANPAQSFCKCNGRFVHEPQRHACPLYLCWGCGKYCPGHGWPACPNLRSADRRYRTNIDVNNSWPKDDKPTDQQILAAGFAASPQ